MPPTASNWSDVQSLWSADHNFWMTGPCAPFDFNFPPIDRVIAEMRTDDMTRITAGTKSNRRVSDDIKDRFNALPIDQAVQSPFALAHFELSRFDAPGKFLHGFEQKVLTPWRSALRDAGFTYERCYPIVFMSGIDCATNYHCDQSHVIAWQIHGSKEFNSLADPTRWVTIDQCIHGLADQLTRPPDLTPDDIITHEMHPGDVLWNALLTPHWVDAADQPAMSVNFSHGGLRLNGQLAPREQALVDYRAAHPDQAPSPVTSHY
jgi:hypothetical protein